MKIYLLKNVQDHVKQASLQVSFRPEQIQCYPCSCGGIIIVKSSEKEQFSTNHKCTRCHEEYEVR